MTNLNCLSHLFVIAMVTSCSKPQTYAADCAKPLSHWKTPADGLSDTAYNIVTVDSDRGLRWNKTPISQSSFVQFLTNIPELEPQPLVILMFESDVDCGKVRSLRRLVDEKLACREMNLCGEGAGDWKSNTRISHVPAPEFQESLGQEVDKMAEDAAK